MLFYFIWCGCVVFFLILKEGKIILFLFEFFEEVIEYEGIEDVEELFGGDYVVWIEFLLFMVVIEGLVKKFEFEVFEFDIVWVFNEEI